MRRAAGASSDPPRVLAFALAGLGCSALLPLTISFSQEQLAAISGAVAGAVIACYQLGYGIAAFGGGPLLDDGVTLPTIYGVSAVIAAAAGALVFVITRQRETAGGYTRAHTVAAEP
jgi:predicted MFS family arabinose efflux permease